MKNKRKRIFEIIQIGQRSDTVSFAFDIFITAVIFINLFCTFFSTFEQSYPYRSTLNRIEFITIVIFAAEYILRIWTAGELYPYYTRPKAVFRFIFSFYGIIDLLTFLPYFLPFVFPQGAVAFRIFRVFRIFRLFKINSSYDAFNVISDVLKEKKDQLISSMCMILILMLASSLCMYSLEHEAQPENFENAFSGIWWSVSTLLTVGYGDIYPITIGGRIMAIIISFLGVGMVAIPTGIISAGFVGQYTKIKVLDNMGRENSLRYLTSVITNDHPFNHSYVKDLILPPQLLLLVVIRDEEELTPDNDLMLESGDILLISQKSIKRNSKDRGSLKSESKSYIELKEIEIGKQHPWIDVPIKSLDISRQDFIALIERDSNMMIPDKNTTIQSGDLVVMYSKSPVNEKMEANIMLPS
ncbi:MAG: ion transporter [Lachnospiraceae bacterium]|nr:ion transporter [Lachnospiraceae bacterium]